MSKHTKLPWTVAKGGLSIQLADGSQIRQLRTVGNAAKYNARLIAAAPELLAALHELQDFVFELSTTFNLEAKQNIREKCGRIVEAAIAKAEGTND